jgi:predicted AAA+ superfamily ATPase
MVYIRRHGEQTIRELAGMFGAVMVSGARQVGKTTLLKEVTAAGRPGSRIRYVSLDETAELKAAREEAETFFEYNKPPAVIDEIQYAPNLFPFIKRIVDQRQEPGLFFLSGSQQFHLMKNVSESLAGRLGILNLTGLSLREIYGTDFLKPFLPSGDYFAEREKALVPLSPDQIWYTIHRGSMPSLWAKPGANWSRFYGAYIRTYIERDVRDLTQVGDELKFLNFMTVLASRTGQLLNLSGIADDTGISGKTAERWLSILKTSNLVYLLQPWHTNVGSRAIKTPKFYFLDTGIAAYLTKWNNPEVLRDGAMAGAFFETFVIGEILKSYFNAGELDPPLFFYRDRDKKEIDLLIWQNGFLHPVEIKKTALPVKADIKAFSALDTIPGIKRGPGGLICLGDKLLPLKGTDLLIPLMFV